MATKKGRKGTSSSVVASKGRKRAVKKQPEESVGGTDRPGRPAPSQRKATASLQRTSMIADLGKIWEGIGKARQPVEFRISCVRPDDMLVCDFIFENLKFDPEGANPPKLVRKDSPGAATLIVEFPPQSFGEEAFLDSTGDSVPTDLSGKEKFPEKTDKIKPQNVVPLKDNAEKLRPMPSAKIRMSGRSRIAFTMPAEERELPYTIDAILDACRRWSMRLDVNAVPDPPSGRFALSQFAVQDKWLASVVTSQSWAQATAELLAAVGGQHQESFAGAARRISQKAITAIRSGRTDGTEVMLRQAFIQELDILTRRFPTLRDSGQRQIAVAALSLLTTKALATFHFTQSVFDVSEKLPFLRIIFSPHEPAKNVTALELPYRLIISPVSESRWHHPTKPIIYNGRTELWQTRLTSTDKDVGPDGPTHLRALWSPDYHISNIIDKVNGNRPFRMSLDPLDREMLVTLMSGFDQTNSRGQAFQPTTSSVRRLALSSLGALLDTEGNWARPVPAGVGLEQWRHLASMGRDHYVRVVYRGFLKDFGHAASLVKVTERKFESFPNKNAANRVAVLRQRFFIVVRERVKHYSGAGHEYDGRNFPFKQIEILTRVTPNLMAPDNPDCALGGPGGNIIYDGTSTADNPPRPKGIPHRACFWPMIDAANNFMFQVAATDLSGNRITFATPLLFVGVEANEHWNPKIMEEIIARNNAEPPNPRRFATIGNASVCYAPFDKNADGDTRLPTEQLIFRAAPVKGIFQEEPQFYPEVESARVGIAAIRRLLQKPQVTVGVTYADVYKETRGGFGGTNQGELFLTITEDCSLKFGNQTKSDAIGGLATPSMAILGLSRIMGPVSAQAPTGAETAESKLTNIINNAFNPADFFKDAKILGGVGLAEILTNVSGLGGKNVPKLLSRELPDKIEASFDWETVNVQRDPAGLFEPHSEGVTTLKMHGVVSSPLNNPGAPTFDATASIVNFRVNLFGFVTVWFDELRFTAKTGAKPDVAVDLHPGDRMIEFGGPLEFVNELRKIIPSNGFSDPPGLTVTPSGISASYSINIPSLAVGIFALEHLSVGAGFLLPFDARPAEVRFNFAERQRPFSLTVSLLGGGGFFAIAVGTEGVREIEAALEFGAALSINLGVASGSVEVKAGVYFHWKTATLELSGYVRLHGELSVLGLISASLTFNLQLGYLKENGKSVVFGEASIEVEIEILFLSFSVSVSCRREFGGSDGDPKFLELIPDQDTWDLYCDAFATEAA